jgi:hypothetical protein
MRSPECGSGQRAASAANTPGRWFGGCDDAPDAIDHRGGVLGQGDHAGRRPDHDQIGADRQPTGSRGSSTTCS